MRSKVALLVIALLGISSVAAIATALADNPVGSGFTIDGTIPDAGTTSFPDPVGSVKELGPENGSSTKLGVINTASTPMLDFTSINGGDDLSGCGSRPMSIRRRSTSGCTSPGSVSARRRARCSSSSTRSHSRLRVTTRASTSHSIRRSPRQSRRSSTPATPGQTAQRAISPSTGISRATRRRWACGRSPAVDSDRSCRFRPEPRSLRTGRVTTRSRVRRRSTSPPRDLPRRRPGDIVQDVRQRDRCDRDRELGYGRLQGHDPRRHLRSRHLELRRDPRHEAHESVGGTGSSRTRDPADSQRARVFDGATSDHGHAHRTISTRIS